MMKNFLILIIFSTLILAQEAGNQSVELPEFVITGKRNVEIPILKKDKPGKISLLEDDFLFPANISEEFKIKSLSDPFTPDTNVNYLSRPYNGDLLIGMGLNTQPKGIFSFSTSSRHIMFNSLVYGLNEREFESFAGYNKSGIKLRTDLFISGASNIFPGAQIGFIGEYKLDNYNFYVSPTASTERRTKYVKAGAEFINNLGNYLNLSAFANIQSLEFENTGVKEKILTFRGIANFEISEYELEGVLNYKKQILDNYTKPEINDLFTLRVLSTFKPFKGVNINAGAIYMHYGSVNEIQPYGKISIKIEKPLTIIASYSPDMVYQPLNKLKQKNMYFTSMLISGNIQENYFNLNTGLRYEFDKYFEIDLMYSLNKFDNYLYFIDGAVKGYFDPVISNDVEESKTGLYLQFHPGPNGQFYGSIEYSDFKFLNGKKVPYKPEIIGDLGYNHFLTDNFNIDVNLKYNSKVYSDIANNNEIDDYLDLKLTGSYYFSKKFAVVAEFENILDKNNYIVNYYKSKPFDIVFSIRYRW